MHDTLIRAEKWEDLPTLMMKLYPRFADIEINKSMRTPDDWNGPYDKLMEK